MHGVTDLLASWSSFYTIVGSAAAALTGLMFVVITLVNARSSSEEGVSTFSTPSVVHFCCVLFVAAVISAPFHALTPLKVLFALAGSAGIVYVTRIGTRYRALTNYKPDAEDWAWHVVLPFFAYALLLGGALSLTIDPAAALFAPATASLLLIFIAIHNAWDVVTFLATGKADALPDAPTDTG